MAFGDFFETASTLKHGCQHLLHKNGAGTNTLNGRSLNVDAELNSELKGQNAHYKDFSGFVYVLLRVCKVDVVSKKSPKATCWGGEKLFMNFLICLICL